MVIIMKRYIVTTLLIGFVFLLGCKKNEKIAPDLKEISGPVDFEEEFKVSTTNPNFSNGEKVYFTAKTKADAYWVVTVVGATSGAVKTFTGTGREITVTNATWDGTADILPSFRTENITMTLSFPKASAVNSTLPLSYAGTIAGVKNLDEGGVLITNFNETPTKIQDVYDGNFAAVPANRWPSNWVETVTRNDTPLPNPDGNRYCLMVPQVAWEDNMDFPGHKGPYIDHMIITANSVGYATYFPLIADPGKIYFNIMMHNSSAASKTWFQITLFEKDVALNDVAKSYNIRPTWEDGWRIVSIPYTGFKLADTTVVSNNPQRITGLQLTLLSGESQEILDAGANPVSASFDHLIFTHNKPYQP